jgi:hypothetical protein
MSRSKRRNSNHPGSNQAPGGGGQAEGMRVVGGQIIDANGQAVRMIRSGEEIDLGDLGMTESQPEPVTATFTVGGQRFRVDPDLTELTVIDLLEQGQGIDNNSPQSMTFVKDYAFAHVHPDDQVEFWKAIRRMRWDTSQIMILCWKILDGITGNPTGERSDSSDGPLDTSQSSPTAASVPDVGPGFPDRPTDRQLIREGLDRTADPLRAAYLKHIGKIQARTDAETGQLLPINAAIAAQLATAAQARGIDLASQSAAATG